MSFALPAALAAALQILVPASPDPTGDAWLEIDQTGGLVMSLNESALLRDGDSVHVQLRMQRQDGQPGERLAVVEARLDCRARTRTLIAIHAYEDDGRLRVSDRNMAGRGTVRAEPGTNLAGLLDGVCHRTGWGEEGAAE